MVKPILISGFYNLLEISNSLGTVGQEIVLTLISLMKKVESFGVVCMDLITLKEQVICFIFG